MMYNVHDLTFWKKPKKISPIFRILPHLRLIPIPEDLGMPKRRPLFHPSAPWFWPWGSGRLERPCPNSPARHLGPALTSTMQFQDVQKGLQYFCGRDFDVSASAPYSGGKWLLSSIFPFFWFPKALTSPSPTHPVRQPLNTALARQLSNWKLCIYHISLSVSLSRTVLLSPHCQIKSRFRNAVFDAFGIFCVWIVVIEAEVVGLPTRRLHLEPPPWMRAAPACAWHPGRGATWHPWPGQAEWKALQVSVVGLCPWLMQLHIHQNSMFGFKSRFRWCIEGSALPSLSFRVLESIYKQHNLTINTFAPRPRANHCTKFLFDK